MSKWIHFFCRAFHLFTCVVSHGALGSHYIPKKLFWNMELWSFILIHALWSWYWALCSFCLSKISVKASLENLEWVSVSGSHLRVSLWVISEYPLSWGFILLQSHWTRYGFNMNSKWRSGLRFGSVVSHPSWVTPNWKLLQCSLRVLMWWAQQNNIVTQSWGCQTSQRHPPKWSLPHSLMIWWYYFCTGLEFRGPCCA